MNFTINGEKWYITEVPQERFVDNEDGERLYFGQTHYDTGQIWLYRDLNWDKKRKTLYHELMHVYIKTFITSSDMKFDEELLCDISANAHDVVQDIAERYFNQKIVDIT